MENLDPQESKMNSSEELLSKSKIHVHELKMDMVPYSIAVQALVLQKAQAIEGGLTGQLNQLLNLEKDLKNLFK